MKERIPYFYLDDNKSAVEKAYFGLFGSTPEDHESDL